MIQDYRHRRLQAPRQDGAVVADPPLEDAAALLEGNRRLLAHHAFAILGRPIQELRRQARAEAAAAARAYLQAAGEPVLSGDHPSLLMAGHQPELFHPGVWVKNFALNRLARLHHAAPINLVVDNDTGKSASLRVPQLAADGTPWPHVVNVPIDRWTGEVPYEERTVRDEAFFASLPSRVEPFTRGWPFKPMLEQFWQEVLRQARRTLLFGERLVAARRSVERRWGCHNLELPVSILCRTESFAWFACHLLGNLARFHDVYNACVHDHRHRYRIRSRNHPVPDLAAQGDWLELPFWAWESGGHNRGRLFARITERQVELRVGNSPWPALPLPADNNSVPMIQAWQALERRGLKVRSRALTNTLFARMFLADLFIHGIGGGKYDELTDAIIRRFYQSEPPGFLVLSATLRLPLPAHPVTVQQRRQLVQQLRDLRYNPQRHLEANALNASAAVELRNQKQAWIGRAPASPREKQERFQVLRALTDQLAPYVGDRLRETQQELSVRAHELSANAILQRRDYAFCLYPEALLQSFCTSFL